MNYWSGIVIAESNQFQTFSANGEQKDIKNVGSEINSDKLLRYIPKYLYNRKYYPDFLAGCGYLMSIDAATKLYSVSMTTPLLHLEDVYLTGWAISRSLKVEPLTVFYLSFQGICAEKAHIEPMHHHLFSHEIPSDPCEFLGMISTHYIRPIEMKRAYDFVLYSNGKCAEADL